MPNNLSISDDAAKAAFKTVYGPVQSWRYGLSLGIDPIGAVSTCSFDCVYCQLGAIERWVGDRQIFIPTHQIRQDLLPFAPWAVDVITLSGSGEPTLALNLGEILGMIRDLTDRPVGVLTNGTQLGDRSVQQALDLAHHVAVKLDAVTPDPWRRINRPIPGLTLDQLWDGILAFRDRYRGQLDIQTMVLQPWSEAEEETYIRWMQQLQPHEIQLNTPTRPKPLRHELDARGNHPPTEVPDALPYAVRPLRPVAAEHLQAMGDRLFHATGIPVRSPHIASAQPTSAKLCQRTRSQARKPGFERHRSGNDFS